MEESNQVNCVAAFSFFLSLFFCLIPINTNIAHVQMDLSSTQTFHLLLSNKARATGSACRKENVEPNANPRRSQQARMPLQNQNISRTTTNGAMSNVSRSANPLGEQTQTHTPTSSAPIAASSPQTSTSIPLSSQTTNPTTNASNVGPQVNTYSYPAPQMAPPPLLYQHQQFLVQHLNYSMLIQGKY